MQGVFEIVAETIGSDTKYINEETSIYDGTDSLDRVGLIFDIETQFSVDISNEEARKIYKVKDILTLLEKKMASEIA